MSTIIFTKEQFIAYLKDGLKESNIIVMTKQVTGQVSYSKHGLKITQLFHKDAFKEKGIAHIAFGTSLPLGLVVVDRSTLSDEALKMLDTTAVGEEATKVKKVKQK